MTEVCDVADRHPAGPDVETLDDGWYETCPEYGEGLPCTSGHGRHRQVEGRPLGRTSLTVAEADVEAVGRKVAADVVEAIDVLASHAIRSQADLIVLRSDLSPQLQTMIRIRIGELTDRFTVEDADVQAAVRLLTDGGDDGE